MGRVFQLFRKGDNIYRFKRALFNADTTSNTEFLRDDRFSIFIKADRFIPGSDPGAIQYTFGATLSGMTPIRMNYSYTHTRSGCLNSSA